MKRKIKNKYRLCEDREILRDYLDRQIITRMEDILWDYGEQDSEAYEMSRMRLSDCMARNLDIVTVRNIIADELGAKEVKNLREEIKKERERRKNENAGIRRDEDKGNLVGKSAKK